MKQILFCAILFMVFCATVQAQSAPGPCPEITVNGPSGVTKPGDHITFTVSVVNAGKGGELGYDWTITNGTLTSGQGTPGIRVLTSKEVGGINVTALVKITGIPVGCPNDASEMAGIAPILPICNLDEFGMLSKYDVRARIDNFYIRLQNDPEIEGFIIVHLNEKENRGLQKIFLNNMYNAIVWLKKDLSRVTFAVLVDKYETNTTLYLIPVGADPPKTDEASILIKGEDFKQKIKTLFSKTN